MTFRRLLDRRCLMVMVLCLIVPDWVWARDSLLPRKDAFDETLYQLSSKENEEIFRATLIGVHFAGKSASATPKIIIVTGQPGAGKSTAITQLEKQGFQGVVLEKDALNAYHPLRESLMRKRLYFTNLYTDIDAKIWLDKLVDHAISHRFNILLHQSAVLPQDGIAWLERVQRSGYEIEIIAIATAFDVSEQSVVARYEAQKWEHGVGKMSCAEGHERFFDALPSKLDAIEAAKAATRVTIIRRNGDVLYENYRDQSGWVRLASAGSVIEAERKRPMSDCERAEQCARVTGIVDLMTQNGSRVADAQRYDTIARLQVRVCASLRASDAFANPFL